MSLFLSKHKNGDKILVTVVNIYRYVTVVHGYSILLFRPHLWGKELYTQMDFFLQSILADRYIHRREM